MKRRMLDIATLGSFFFTTLVLMKAGWLSAAQSVPQQAEILDTAEDYSTQSALRYRRCQENHWRSCVLRR